MRILVVMGTRPEVIKLGPVCRELAKRPGVELEVFWTGQHVELAAGLADLFDIKPTYYGADIVAENGLAGKFGRMCQQIERVLVARSYDWLVVEGDTTTVAAAAVAAFSNRVPVAHVEAGLRTFNIHSPFPEEYNRRLCTISADVHFAPTEAARDNLQNEGVSSDRILVTGNTVVDALLYARSRVSRHYSPINSEIADIPLDKKLVLVTLHRRENIGEPMQQVLFALREIAQRNRDAVIVLPVHMNPDVRSAVTKMLGDISNIRLLQPLQYTDLVYLMTRAWTVVTDSGGIQEEAPSFGLQILITRDSTERPECVQAGFGKLVGSDFQAIVSGVERLLAGAQRALLATRSPFGDGEASRRIADRLTNSLEPALAAE